MAQSASWLPARRHLTFVVGLLLASGMALALDRGLQARGGLPPELLPQGPTPPWAPQPLSADDQRLARSAWSYLRQHTQATGLVDSVHQYPSSTMWDSASALLGILSATRLGVVPKAEGEARARKLLEALARLPLVDGKLPNKAYRSTDLAMVDYANQAAPKGIGWSALDVGRLGVALSVAQRAFPGLAPAAASVLAHLKLEEAVKEGELWGLRRGPQGDRMEQEGRLGYAQYAAQSYALMGAQPWEALRPERHLKWVPVQGQQLPADDRDAKLYGAHTYVLSEPYVLAGLEFGWEGPWRVMAERLALAQEARSQASGKLTAVSEDHLDRKPYFVYNTAWSDGEAWLCLTEAGEARPQDRSLSAKAALGWAVLRPQGPLAQDYRRAVYSLAKPEGVMAGRYEADQAPNTVLSCNTNAVVLEALACQAHGPLLRWGPQR